MENYREDNTDSVGKPSAIDLSKANKKRKGSGAGGAWRAYIHDKCKGHRFGASSLKELARSYKALTSEQKEVWK